MPKHAWCDKPFTHFDRGCKLLLHYDRDGDGIITEDDTVACADDWTSGKITADEQHFVVTECFLGAGGNINDLCPECYKEAPEKTKPSVRTLYSTPQSTSAKLVGELTDTGNLTCNVWFEYGKSKASPKKTRKSQVTKAQKFSVTPSNLESNQTYYFRAVASNDKGTVYGDWKSFTTEEKVKPEPAFFKIAKIDAPSVVKVGESFTIKATVKNTGEESGTEDIVFMVDGTEVSSESLTLSGGKTDTVSCTHTLDTMGDHSIKASSDDDSSTATVTGKSATPSLIDKLANLLGVTPEQAKTYVMAAGGVLALIIILSIV